MESVQKEILYQLTRIADALSGGVSSPPRATPKVDDPFRYFFKSQEDYEETVALAKSCKKSKDIRNRIYRSLLYKGYDSYSISARDFLVCLVPHLENYQGSKDISNVKRAMY